MYNTCNYCLLLNLIFVSSTHSSEDECMPWWMKRINTYFTNSTLYSAKFAPSKFCNNSLNYDLWLLRVLSQYFTGFERNLLCAHFWYPSPQKGSVHQSEIDFRIAMLNYSSVTIDKMTFSRDITDRIKRPYSDCDSAWGQIQTERLRGRVSWVQWCLEKGRRKDAAVRHGLRVRDGPRVHVPEGEETAEDQSYGKYKLLLRKCTFFLLFSLFLAPLTTPVDPVQCFNPPQPL